MRIQGVQNNNNYQYKPFFAMKIADPTTYSTKVFVEMQKFIENYGKKFPSESVIKEIHPDKFSRFSKTVIDTGENIHVLGSKDEEIIDSLNRLRSRFGASV